MINKSLWQQIKDVVDADRKVASLEQDISSTQQALEKDQNTLANLDVIINEKKQKLFNLQKTAKLNELEGKELKEKEDRKRQQLNAAKGQKEYKALEREIAHLSSKRLELEENVVKQWYAVDMLTKEVESLTSGRQAHIDQLHDDMRVKKELLVQLQNNLDTAHHQRMQFFATLPTEWQVQFERMKHSVADPMVPILGNSCSACFYSISHQDLSKIKKGGVIPCRSCYRFLYYDNESESVATKAMY